MWRLKLARLAVNLMLAAAVETILCLQTVSAAPISAIDPHSGEPAQGGPPSCTAGSLLEKKTTPPDPLIDVPGAHIPDAGTLYSVEATGWPGAGLFFDHSPTIASESSLFDSREFEPNVADDNHKYWASAICVFPDSYLRARGEDDDDCKVVKPDADASEVLTLPFLAILGWGLVIVTVAGSYNVFGNWRVRRWVRRVAAQGVEVGAAKQRGVARGTDRRSSSRSKPRSRRYAG
jgi:hypothetical protein